MSSKRKYIYLFLLFIYVNHVNIILLLITRIYGIASVRADIMYDYILVGLLISLRVNNVVVWLSFALITILDVTSIVSETFLFTMVEFVKSFQFSSLYATTSLQYVLIFAFVVYIALNYYAIRKFTNYRQIPRLQLSFFFIVYFVLVYGLDFLNGQSVINRSAAKYLAISDSNIGESCIKNTAQLIFNLTVNTFRPKLLTKSKTFETFSSDTTGNQFLIILESWGLPKNKMDWEKLQRVLAKVAMENNWTSKSGAVPFKGSTTYGELRELLNASGDYRYFLNKDSSKLFKSIFEIKKDHGYKTLAAHSFTGKMFERSIWWKNVGVDSLIFLETLVSKNGFSRENLNYSNPFTSLNDEETFRAVVSLSGSSQQKVFVYLLTENTHLPYYSKTGSNRYFDQLGYSSKLSDEANNQIKRIMELLSFFIVNLGKENWSKVLIVGDHMPPFFKESDRSFYSSKYVPYIQLNRIN